MISEQFITSKSYSRFTFRDNRQSLVGSTRSDLDSRFWSNPMECSCNSMQFEGAFTYLAPKCLWVLDQRHPLRIFPARSIHRFSDSPNSNFKTKILNESCQTNLLYWTRCETRRELNGRSIITNRLLVRLIEERSLGNYFSAKRSDR